MSRRNGRIENIFWYLRLLYILQFDFLYTIPIGLQAVLIVYHRDREYSLSAVEGKIPVQVLAIPTITLTAICYLYYYTETPIGLQYQI